MLKPEQILDSVNVNNSLLISRDTMLQALSEFTGQKVVQFVEEASVKGAWWLFTETEKGDAP